MAPDHPAVLAGRIRALVAAGLSTRPRRAVAALPDDLQGPRASTAPRPRSNWPGRRPAVDDLGALAAEVAADPDDHGKRFDLANAQMAAGDRDAAADNFLHIVAAERDWNEGAARASC